MSTPTHDDPAFSVEGARQAAERDELREWVRRFLASPGSDNHILAEKLARELPWWTGPVEVPLNRLERLAGPPGDPVLCPVDEDYWDERVESMDKLAEKGWDPTPVVVSWADDRLTLEDGNHRVEAVRQAGRRTVSAVIGFTRREDRDRFERESAEKDDVAAP